MEQKQQKLNEKLFYAAGNGNLEEVKQLISKGANVNWKDSGDWVSFNIFIFYNNLIFLN